MADRIMPQSDPNPPMPPGSNPSPAPGMPGEAGEAVMISMPRQVFDQLHQLVRDLADGVEELAQSVAGDAAQGGMPGEEMSEQPPMGPPMAEGEISDEDFLKEVAMQGTK